MSAKELILDHLQRRHPEQTVAPGETKPGLTSLHGRLHTAGLADHIHPEDGHPAFRLADENLIEEGAA